LITAGRSARRRVAVTGLGLVTPLGNDVPATWRAILAGESGIGPITLFEAGGLPTRIASEVKGFDPDRAGDRKTRKLASRQHRFALAAAEEALAGAGLRPEDGDPGRWGCVVGSGMISTDFAVLDDLQRRFGLGEGLDDALLGREGLSTIADPVEFCRTQTVAGLSLLLQRFGIRGHSATVHTACASGGQAVGAAMKAIRAGWADRVLAGGFDSMIHPLGVSGFCLLGALSTDNHDPRSASRPFDRTRNGFVLGEGAGFLVLEEWEGALRRGARVLAEVAGDGNSLSAYRITDSHPSGDGPIQAIRNALRDAGVEPHEVDYINAHGTSTPMNDRSECRAIEAVLGERARSVAVSSTKSQMGHLIAAAGAVEAAICVLSIRDGRLPATMNLRQPDPECALDFVPLAPRTARVRVAISNCFGFGGSNNSLVLRAPEEAGR
jgi:3-oxoacyl-(acyl-carrier-protein) synthase